MGGGPPDTPWGLALPRPGLGVLTAFLRPKGLPAGSPGPRHQLGRAGLGAGRICGEWQRGGRSPPAAPQHGGGCTGRGSPRPPRLPGHRRAANLSLGTQQGSVSRAHALPSRAKSRPWGTRLPLTAEGFGGPAWSPRLPCSHPPQGSSDFCVDPDTYVTRMVDEHSVLSGGECVATSELVPPWPG